MRLCIEASGLSPWVGRILSELGHEVIVANAQRVRLIAQSTLKNGTVDAETLVRPGICRVRNVKRPSSINRVCGTTSLETYRSNLSGLLG